MAGGVPETSRGGCKGSEGAGGTMQHIAVRATRGTTPAALEVDMIAAYSSRSDGTHHLVSGCRSQV